MSLTESHRGRGLVVTVSALILGVPVPVAGGGGVRGRGLRGTASQSPRASSLGWLWCGPGCYLLGPTLAKGPRGVLGQDSCPDRPCELKRRPQLWQKPTHPPTPSMPSLVPMYRVGARGTRGLV